MLKTIRKLKLLLKKHGDFGRSPIIQHHLTIDNDFLDFRNYIGQKSWEYLDHQGFDMSTVYNYV
jgi:hypothetical protein